MREKSIWKTPINTEELNQRGKNSFSDHLGIVFTEVDETSLTATMKIDQKALQPMGIMHGGASAALAETVASAAGNYCIDQKELVAVGLELNINHLRAVQSGTLFAKAKPFHLGKTTQVWEIQIFDEKRNLISVSRLTLCVIKKNPRSSERG